ncbi:hypothetical protein MY10362_008518, partial [Beauveria mimosiformis]
MQRTASRLAIKYVGVAAEALPSGYRTTAQTVEKSMEIQYPKATSAQIQGTRPHISSKDPGDEKEVITVSYHTVSGTRVASVHLHDD